MHLSKKYIKYPAYVVFEINSFTHAFLVTNDLCSAYLDISVTEVFHFLSDLIRTGPEQNPARTELISFRKKSIQKQTRLWQNLATTEPDKSRT
jgi:hypothetical protein